MNASGSTLPPCACAQCRRWLLLHGRRPHALSADEAGVAVHMRDCASCQAYAAQMLGWRRLGERLREHVIAPTAVRQRVFRDLALARTHWLREQVDARKRWWLPALVFMAALVVVAGVRMLTIPPSGADATSAVLDDHWRDAHHQHIDSSDPAAVEQWLASRLTIPVRASVVPGAALQGARLCFLRGRLGAVVRYRVDDAMVSYYVMPADTRIAETERDNVAIRAENEQGYNLVVWREHGLVHALVGGLPRARLQMLATAYRTGNAG